ncbi:GAF domain-containing protein [Streptomyces sp. NPDC060194]|uniref:GAF domain-containing protein n=1 Tax=Streptomyces sp. NPDC060194 TaxID=3347069 RepID=UPI00365918A5
MNDKPLDPAARHFVPGPGGAPRALIDASWRRVRRLGVDPDRVRTDVLLPADEVEHRRRSSALGAVLPLLRHGLAGIADEAVQIMVVTDDQGHVLWRAGHRSVLRRADGICLAEGAAWSERFTGTNGIGTALAVRRPVRVHSVEHTLRALHSWTCAASPVHDPRDGRLLGVVDLSGPGTSFHPAVLSLVESVARLAESELRERHRVTLDRLRATAAPLLGRIGGRAVAVDAHGWTAAVTGMPPVDRVALPRGLAAGRVWLPSLGRCRAEPLPGGWLLTVDDDAPAGVRPTRVVLDLSRPHRWSVTVSGAAGEWTHELTPRHAELLYVLASHREGRTAAQLAADLFGDPSRTVTVRAELSRVRRGLAEVLAHRPYRFADDVDVELVRPSRREDLLPHSSAPAVRRERPADGEPAAGER